MTAPVTLHKNAKADTGKGACGDLSVMCGLSIVGLLVGLVALLQGLTTASFIPSASTSMPAGDYYWLVVILGIWLPALGLMGSIIGLTIRNRWAVPVLLVSPLVSIIGFCLYSYAPLSSIV